MFNARAARSAATPLTAEASVSTTVTVAFLVVFALQMMAVFA